MNLPLRSNAYDDVTDFEICLFHKNTKTWILERETYFFLEIKTFINCAWRASYWKKKLCSEGFKILIIDSRWKFVTQTVNIYVSICLLIKHKEWTYSSFDIVDFWFVKCFKENLSLLEYKVVKKQYWDQYWDSILFVECCITDNNGIVWWVDACFCRYVSVFKINIRLYQRRI